MNNKKINKFELQAMTVNERLYHSGLLDEFEKALKNNHIKAKEILRQVYVDKKSINLLLSES